MYSSLGVKIRKVRELRDFSQSFVADKLSVSQGYYSDLENGRKGISEQRLSQIASILEVDKEIIRNFNDQVVFNSCQQSGYINTINNPLDKIDELYNKIIASKDERIADLTKIIQEKDALLRKLDDLK
jgi:transcriptional regulator with XRE-family HTH domain